MKNRVLILGTHPIASYLLDEYEKHGCLAENKQQLTVADEIDNYDELCMLTSVYNVSYAISDSKAIEILGVFAKHYDIERHDSRKLRCHLLLQSNDTLRLLQTNDLSEEVRKNIDVYPFTMLDIWSRKIVYDYEPITIQSEKTIHIVLFGAGDVAENVAINAALVSHFPNFTCNHALKTRITIIDDNISKECGKWLMRYKHLFDNSYYRIVTPREQHSIKNFHSPQYLEHGFEDFVDVEWEFVEASVHDEIVSSKLKLWTSEQSQQLVTIIFAHSNETRNIEETTHLPKEVYSHGAQIYAYTQNDSIMRLLNISENSAKISPFGMMDKGYDIRIPLVQMAKTVNYVYSQCYNDNIANWSGKIVYSVEVDKDERERLWQKLSIVKRMSNIYNAMTVPVKMRSVGLNENDWEKFYDISQQDIEILAEVEHNRWCVEELILGWRPCTQEEKEMVDNDIEKKEVLKKTKVHYDLRPYRNLKPDASGKPVEIYDICLCSCLPLITKSFIDEKGGLA